MIEQTSGKANIIDSHSILGVGLETIGQDLASGTPPVRIFWDNLGAEFFKQFKELLSHRLLRPEALVTPGEVLDGSGKVRVVVALIYYWDSIRN